MDWQQQLNQLRDSLPEGDTTAAENETAETGTTHPRLDIILERKGRAGKQATIICGFTCDDDEVKEIASALKKALGTGGSARGGEILIQGDRRKDVLEALKSMGIKARII